MSRSTATLTRVDLCACGAAKMRRAGTCRGCYLSDRMSDARFWAGADKSGGPAACWPWTRALTRGGYGQASAHDKSVTASRRAWELANGPVTDGLWVLHHCDNRRCVNPAHLFLGTADDNVQDMRRKGRARVSFGEAHPNARLTAAQVRELRDRYQRGGITQRQLGREFGIAQTGVSRIVRGIRWARA